MRVRVRGRVDEKIELFTLGGPSQGGVLDYYGCITVMELTIDARYFYVEANVEGVHLMHRLPELAVPLGQHRRGRLDCFSVPTDQHRRHPLYHETCPRGGTVHRLLHETVQQIRSHPQQTVVRGDAADVTVSLRRLRELQEAR